MATAKQKYTMVAAKALSLHELFVTGFAKGLDGPIHFAVELSAPDGPSTGGGKQALQHIKLIPDGGGLAVVIGSADTALSVAEVRTFEHVATLYAQRFHGAPLPVDPTRYAELSRTLVQFFGSLGMKVSVVPLTAAPQVGGAQALSPAAPPRRSGGALLWIVAVVVAVAVVGGAYAVIFLRR
jgi:hypothetical protein